MSRTASSARFSVAFTICIVLGLIEAALIVAASGHFRGGVVALVLGLLLWVGLGVILGALQLFPYAFIVLGFAKLREQKRESLEALGDENKVRADPDGERKLHDYLTAITSTEARIGLLQRSTPWIPPEQRPLEGTTPLRTTLSKPGWGLVCACLAAGAAVGGAIGLRNGLGETTTGFVLLIAAALFGMVLASPLGILLAVLMGLTQRENRDDAGTSSGQAA